MPPDSLLRYLHATYSPPSEGATDGELLRRCASLRDDVAFELLMRRYSDLVWKVCRAVTRNHHTAEDAFQATFLALARKAGTIGGETLAGWLCRVAYHAALKARPRQIVEPMNGPISSPSNATEHNEIARVLHEELNRLADCYRAPLILCYLQNFTQAEAARQLGWPLGTVATRVLRGRDRLRDRLIRRGLVLCSGVILAALMEEPASALPANLIAGTVRAISTGTGLSPAVRELTQGVVNIMRPIRLQLAAAVFILAAGVALAYAASADPEIPPGPPANEKAEEKVKEKLIEERPPIISPGIQAMVSLSTDINVADVVETQPSKAIEGARDTVKLKVVRTLLGQAKEGETIGVYYHLHWADEKSEILEAPKFIKGKRYVVFLNTHQLTDPWLSVLSDHIVLVKEIAAAIRVSHGDARSEWSSTDGSIAGLQGRLVAYRENPGTSGTPVITVYLELRRTAGGNGRVEFSLEGAKTAWSVSDADGKVMKPTSPPGNWLPSSPRKLKLEGKESGRIQLTISGGGIMLQQAGHLELGSEQVWEFAKGDKKTYFLSGNITIDATGQRDQWYGTLKLSKVRIPLGE